MSKTKLKLTLLLLSLFCTVTTSYAQFYKRSNLSIDMQYRPRIEYQNGYKMPLDKSGESSIFTAHRARIGFNYNREILTMKLALQNVSKWGTVGFAPESNTIFNEAWLQLKNRDGLFMQIGRQPLHYDDGRLLSACNWGHYGRFHDVLKMGYESREHILHGAFAYNQPNRTVVGNDMGLPYKTMQMLYYQYKKSNNYAIFHIYKCWV